MNISELKQLSGLLTESEDIHDIKGSVGKNWFYLVCDPSNKNAARKSDVQLKDIICRARLGAIVDIFVGGKLEYKNPELYPDSEKAKALADAKARLDALLDD